VKKSLGIIDGRVTYVIDPQGVVREVFSSQLRTKQHHARALEVIKAGATA
jgi:peroxiredoxin Q/BCP